MGTQPCWSSALASGGRTPALLGEPASAGASTLTPSLASGLPPPPDDRPVGTASSHPHIIPQRCTCLWRPQNQAFLEPQKNQDASRTLPDTSAQQHRRQSAWKCPGSSSVPHPAGNPLSPSPTPTPLASQRLSSETPRADFLGSLLQFH